MITRSKFLKKYGAKTVSFAKLPLLYQMAIIHYMVIDGEGWDSPDQSEMKLVSRSTDERGGGLINLRKIQRWIKKHLDFWIKANGKEQFGMVEVPTDDFCKLIFEAHKNDLCGDDFKSFDEYHRWYINSCLWKDSDKHYSKAWPAILGDDWNFKQYEILQDGWHRFHSYVKQGKKTIPLVYYV